MATSQVTWAASGVPGVKELAGEKQAMGGSANPSPDFAAGNWGAVKTPMVKTVGWASPNAEADAHNKGGC